MFAAFLGGREVTREAGRRPGGRSWPPKACCPATVNGKLTALDRLFGFSGLGGLPGEAPEGAAAGCSGSSGRELTREEYDRLVETARQHWGRVGWPC